MATVGQILRQTREEKLYTLDEVEKATKIRRELLESLERDDYAHLPPPTFVQGFIKNYARFLNLDSEKLLAIFRREFSEKKHRPYIMETFSKPVKQKKFTLTPTKVIGLVVSLVIITFFAYLWFQYRQFMGAPELTITSPIDQLTTSESVILVEGKTDPEGRLLINGQEIGISAEGNFRQELTLTEPVTKISIMATSKLGQQQTVERTIYLRK